MNPRSAPIVLLSPAFMLGALLALYFLIGRWTFARLSGVYDTGQVWNQPRVWVVGVLLLLAGLIFYEIRFRGMCRVRNVDLALIVWLLYTIATYYWAPDTELATEKVVDVSLLLLVAIAVALGRSPMTEGKAMLGFWYALVVMGTAMGLLALWMSSGGRTFTPTGGPNIFGRNMGLVGVGAFLLASRHLAVTKSILYVVVVMSAIWVLMCGSRGALLASVAAGVVLVLSARAHLFTRIAATVVFSAGGVLMMFYTKFGRAALEVFQLRIVELTINEGHTASRDHLFSHALEVGLEHPVFGCGLSGFQANSWTYPHNMFLEAFAEGGAVGLVLLLWVFWEWWRALRRAPEAKTGSTLAAVALVVTAASFSGDLYDSRGVLLLLALTIEPLGQSVPAIASATARQPHPIRTAQHATASAV